MGEQSTRGRAIAASKRLPIAILWLPIALLRLRVALLWLSRKATVALLALV